MLNEYIYNETSLPLIQVSFECNQYEVVQATGLTLHNAVAPCFPNHCNLLFPTNHRACFHFQLDNCRSKIKHCSLLNGTRPSNRTHNCHEYFLLYHNRTPFMHSIKWCVSMITLLGLMVQHAVVGAPVAVLLVYLYPVSYHNQWAW